MATAASTEAKTVYTPLQRMDPKAPGLTRGLELVLNQKRPKSVSPTEHASTDPRELSFALQYLDAFGYLTKNLVDWKGIKLADIVRAVKLFQEMFGIPKTGQICTKVVRAMETPRCGCPDVARAHQAQAKAVRAWAKAMLPAWRKRNLVYTITDYIPGLSQANQDNVIANAFSAWTSLGNIEAKQVDGTTGADIMISTGSGPRSNFDGPGGTLAWCYLPNGNDQQLLMKFDLGETWVLGPAERGIVLLNVATHELGHAFGLEHSRVSSALMAPYYNVAIAVPQQNDDVGRFQARYGVRASVPAPTTPTPTTPTPTTPTPTTPTPTGQTRIAIEGDALVWRNGKLLN